MKKTITTSLLLVALQGATFAGTGEIENGELVIRDNVPVIKLHRGTGYFPQAHYETNSPFIKTKRFQKIPSRFECIASSGYYDIGEFTRSAEVIVQENIKNEFEISTKGSDEERNFVFKGENNLTSELLIERNRDVELSEAIKQNRIKLFWKKNLDDSGDHAYHSHLNLLYTGNDTSGAQQFKGYLSVIEINSNGYEETDLLRYRLKCQSSKTTLVRDVKLTK